MTFSKGWWTADLEDEPCAGCGVTPSKHMGHGAFTCQKCYEAGWCSKCGYGLDKDHKCPSADERVRRHREFGVTQVMILNLDEQREAIELAEELTREERHAGGFVPTCYWCGSQKGTPDGIHFVHEPSCKWARFRKHFDEHLQEDE